MHSVDYFHHTSVAQEKGWSDFGSQSVESVGNSAIFSLFFFPSLSVFHVMDTQVTYSIPAEWYFVMREDYLHIIQLEHCVFVQLNQGLRLVSFGCSGKNTSQRSLKDISMQRHLLIHANTDKKAHTHVKQKGSTNRPLGSAKDFRLSHGNRSCVDTAALLCQLWLNWHCTRTDTHSDSFWGSHRLSAVCSSKLGLITGMMLNAYLCVSVFC